VASQNVSNRLKEVCTRCGQEFPEGTRFCPNDNSELMMTMIDPLIGTVLPRRYRILSPLGRGAMSVVYKGSYEPLDQIVAIKMLKSHLVSELSSSNRFQQEIKMAGRLNHPNIVGILDFGFTQQHVPYLVMEYLDGRSLGEVLKQEGRLPVSRAIKIFTQCAEALAYAHQSYGIIHRDIKPTNIILVDTSEDTDVVKIVDFGIAKIQSGSGLKAAVSDDSSLAQTAAGELVGTPLYMSPEQSMGKELDGRSDVYALGCVLYQALTGKPPFVGSTVLETIRMQISAAPESIELARPDLFFPERLQQVIMRCLAKDPRMRFQRMEHLASELEACGRKVESPLSSDSYRTISSSACLQAIPTPEDSGLRINFSSSVPWLCALLAVIAIVGTITWGVLTDIGKKAAVVKVPLPVDLDWKNTCNEAQAAFSSGSYAQAEEQYKEALDIAKRFRQPDARVATTLNHLAYVYDSEDKLDQAKHSSEQAVAVEKQLSPADGALTADTLFNLCRINCELGNVDQAEKFGRQALNLREQTLGHANADVAAAMQALAEVECKRGNYERANELLTNALPIAQNAIGKESPEVASIMHDLGMVREKQGNLKGAEQLLNRALGIRQKQLGVEHPLVADTLSALGTLDFNMHKDAEAEQLFITALSIRQKCFGEDSSRTAEVYSCLAILYDSIAKYDKAEECYRKAAEIREKVWGKTSPRLVHSLQNLAKFLREHNQVNGADVYEQQIKRIQRQ
jgi:serine/threonine protein kinase